MNHEPEWLAQLLSFAACPTDHSPLKTGSAALVERFNTLIEQRALRDVTGTLINLPVDLLLVRSDRKRAYPIRGRIAELLPESAILLDDSDRAACDTAQ